MYGLARSGRQLCISRASRPRVELLVANGLYPWKSATSVHRVVQFVAAGCRQHTVMAPLPIVLAWFRSLVGLEASKNKTEAVNCREPSDSYPSWQHYDLMNTYT
jgi:hypothetical protein